MKSIAAVLAAGATILATSIGAETLPLSHTPVPGTSFSDALNAQDLAIEASLNTSSDIRKSKANLARKTDMKDKAFGTLFGSIRNNAGSPICGLVLANGQFMFSCAPIGSYSIDTVTDSQGLIGAFGFADGHYPYHVNLTGFGRWDMTLKVAPPSEPQEHTITFDITDGCNNGIQIDYKFYDVTNNLVWPSATTHYNTLQFGETYHHALLCHDSAKVCYGARSAGFYWGIDVDGSKSCSDCCIFCEEGKNLSRRLTC
jgi:hypothetical protein